MGTMQGMNERAHTTSGAVRRRLLVLAALVAVLAIALTGAASAATSGSVYVSASVAPSLSSTFSDNDVVVSGNVSWELSATLPSGEQFVVLGEPTAGDVVHLPEGVTAVDVCAR